MENKEDVGFIKACGNNYLKRITISSFICVSRCWKGHSDVDNKDKAD